jgi:hypothetical protein
MPIRGDNQPEDGPAAINEVIFDKDSGEVVAPYSGQTVAAVFPFEHAGQPPEAPKSTRRERLTRWITAQENPYFARSFVNRLWSYLLGVGIIEPVDDIRAGNPPTNPELLDHLTEDFVAHGFDVRHLIRMICRSRVYQHASSSNRWNEDDETNYSHALPRRLPAEVLYDALQQATGWTGEIPGLVRGTRAAELPGPDVKLADGFFDLFGRPPRESPCECERSSSTSLGQALNLVNGATIATALEHPQGSISSLVAAEKRPEKVVEELFLALLARPPSAPELRALCDTLDPGQLANADSLSARDREEIDARFEAWQRSQRLIPWTALEPALAKSSGCSTLTVAADGSVVATGESPDKDTYTIVAWTDVQGITGLRLEALPGDDLKQRGPGRADGGNFVLSEVSVAAAAGADPGPAASVVLENPSALFSQDGWPVAAAIDGKRETGWAVSPRFGEEHHAVFELREKVGGPGGTTLIVKLNQQHGARHTLGRFRLAVTAADRPLRASGLPRNIAALLALEPAKRSAEEQAALFRYYVAKDPEMAQRIRLSSARDIAWALINTPAFLFNR